MVLVEGGRCTMGSDDPWSYPEDREAPVREVEVGGFWIDVHAVSNASFGLFVDDTGFVTEAERFGWSFVFAGLLPDDFPPTQAVAQAPWWRKVEAADWPYPTTHTAAAIASRLARGARRTARPATRAFAACVMRSSTQTGVPPCACSSG
jgi:formylglycine-generating enzyme required for sulfatase activity